MTNLKDKLNTSALAVRDWVVKHPWPIAMFVAGFVLGRIL